MMLICNWFFICFSVFWYSYWNKNISVNYMPLHFPCNIIILLIFTTSGRQKPISWRLWPCLILFRHFEVASHKSIGLKLSVIEIGLATVCMQSCKLNIISNKLLIQARLHEIVLVRPTKLNIVWSLICYYWENSSLKLLVIVTLTFYDHAQNQ